jgi:hypothetical protein
MASNTLGVQNSHDHSIIGVSSCAHGYSEPTRDSLNNQSSTTGQNTGSRNIHPKVQVRYKYDKTTGNGHLEYSHSFCLDEEKDPWETAIFKEVKMEDIGGQLDFVAGSLSRLVEDWKLGENYELNWLGD